MKHKTVDIAGYRLPPPRTTAAGYWMIAKYILAPIFALLLLGDVLLYFLFTRGLDSCYGVLCLLE